MLLRNSNFSNFLGRSSTTLNNGWSLAEKGPGHVSLPLLHAIAEYALRDAELMLKQWRGYCEEALDPSEQLEARAIAAFACTRMQAAKNVQEQLAKAAMTMPHECPECLEITDTGVKIQAEVAAVNLRNDELEAQLQAKNSEIERLRFLVMASTTGLRQLFMRAERQSQSQSS